MIIKMNWMPRHLKRTIQILCALGAFSGTISEKILYGGCFVKSTESEGLGNIADAALDEWAMSIKRVMKACRNPQYVIPGHQSWDNKKGLKHTLKLLRKQ